MKTDGPHLQTDRSARAVRILLACLVAYFFAQIVAYFASTRFFGQGITYLLNFVEIGLKGYVRVYLLESSYYPPFYYLWLLAVRPLAGDAYTPYVLWSSLLVAGGALYAFALVRRMAGPWHALLAAAVFLLAPATTIFSKALIIEAPLMLFIPATVYHLVASERFTRPGHCALLGVYLGLGLLTKWTFSAYVVGVLALGFADAVFDAGERRLRPLAVRQWLGTGLALVVACALSGWWYLLVFDLGTWRATAANDPRFLEYSYLRQLAYSVHLLWINYGKTFGPFILAFLALCLPFSRRFPARALLLFAALVALPFLLFAVPVHMEDRYLYPLVFGLAVVCALVVNGVRWRFLRAGAAAAIVGVLLFNHAVVYYPLETDMFRDDDPVIHRWGRLFWGTAHTPEILARIEAFADERGIDRPLTVAPHPLWSSYHCNFLYMLYFLKTDPAASGRLETTRYTKFRYKEFSDGLDGFDFVVFDEGFRTRYMRPETDEMRKYLQALSARNYVDQNYGIEFERFDVDDVWKDYARILNGYRELATFHWEGAYDVKLFVNRRLLPETAPEPAAPDLPTPETPAPAAPEAGTGGAP